MICKLFHKSLKNKVAPMLPFHEARANDETDERNKTFITSIQFPMSQEDFFIDLNPLCPLIDLDVPFYSTVGGSSSMEPGISPMFCIDNLDLDGI